MTIRKSVVLVTLTMCLLSAKAGWASMITFSDVFDPLDVFFSGQSSTACTGSNGAVDTSSASTCGSLTWTQSLPNLDVSDVLTSGTLTLTAYNDTSTNGQTFNLLVDLLNFDGTVTDGSTQGSPNTFSFILTQLPNDAVQVTLTPHNGNHSFFFAQSELDAVVDRSETGSPFETPATEVSVAPSVVSEPGTLILVGFGLLSTSRVARRWRKKL